MLGADAFWDPDDELVPGFCHELEGCPFKPDRVCIDRDDM